MDGRCLARALWLGGVLLVLVAAPVQADLSPAAARGERIYQAGILASGGALRAVRGTVPLEGKAAACANCHRRSGLGSYEGSVLIPPITGPYLFRDRKTIIEDLDLPHIAGYTPNERAYDAESLARALRTGAGSGGRSLSQLMPRYAIDDGSMGDLVEYLNTLSVGPMPGVSDETLEFATIVTPDADAVRVETTLAVLDTYFKLRDTAMAPRVQRGRQSTGEYRTNRSWRLHVWRLTGASSEWQHQMHELQASQPVFAVISGVGNAQWAPVHAFCEADHVPCLFPNIDLPVVAEQDFYPLYFSRGVLLEADLIAADLSARKPAGGARLVQVFRPDDVGAQAAAALEKRALPLRYKVARRSLTAGPVLKGREPSSALASILTAVHPSDTLVLWLRPADLAMLPPRPPTAAVYLSGTMGSLEGAPLPPAWKRVARMTYPYDLPDARRVRLNFPHAWFQSHGIRVTDDVLQTNTYVACQVLTDAIDSMLDAFVPELLIERLENMLAQRAANGYFPRLSVGTGQRFASKGGYIVRFVDSPGAPVRAEGPWIIPAFD